MLYNQTLLSLHKKTWFPFYTLSKSSKSKRNWWEKVDYKNKQKGWNKKKYSKQIKNNKKNKGHNWNKKKMEDNF
jgi:hypothetical protein